MLEVAQWLVQNTPFDRLYFYGNDKPLHVSYGEEHNRAIVLMLPGKSGRLVPKVVTAAVFDPKMIFNHQIPDYTALDS